MKILLTTFAIIILFFQSYVSAEEQIPITISGTMDHVVFDGKWTFYKEWKQSSMYTLFYNDQTRLELRTAHQGNFIYVFVDAESINKYSKGLDKAIICFDGKNDKTQIPDENDYCFGVTLGHNNPFVLRGGSLLEQTNHYSSISDSDVIAVGSISDENDRYSSIPHPGYEFRIPTSLIDRSDIYGFYLGLYDSHSNFTYTYPKNLTINSQSDIPSPSKWGEIISPDKTLPEFPIPLAIFALSLVAIIFVTRKQYFKF